MQVKEEIRVNKISAKGDEGEAIKRRIGRRVSPKLEDYKNIEEQNELLCQLAHRAWNPRR